MTVVKDHLISAFRDNSNLTDIVEKESSLTTLNEKFLQGVPPFAVYRALFENEVGRPAFATEKGSS